MTTKVDLRNERYGRLTVIERAEYYLTKEGVRVSRWLCICDCGTETIVRQGKLRGGKTRSCGCLNREMIIKRNEISDITGKKYGRLTVISCAEPNFSKTGRRISRWLCICDCGNEVTILQNLLLYGKTKSCGCLQREIVGNLKKKDITGERYGRLTALLKKPQKTKDGQSIWQCKCDCGNDVDILLSSLTSGRTKSCGCYKQEVLSNLHLNDLTDQQFGEWKVLKRADNNANGGTRWFCICNCGTEKILSSGDLSRGHSRSCGCLKSKLISEIKSFDRTGFRYGNLVALRRVTDYILPSGIKVVMWECDCDCGNKTTVSAGRLQSGNTKSCGCLSNGFNPDKSAILYLITHSEWRKGKIGIFNEGNPRLRDHIRKGWEVYRIWNGDGYRIQATESIIKKSWNGKGITKAVPKELMPQRGYTETVLLSDIDLNETSELITTILFQMNNKRSEDARTLADALYDLVNPKVS